LGGSADDPVAAVVYIHFMTKAGIFYISSPIKPSLVAGLPNENNINPRLACISPLLR